MCIPPCAGAVYAFSTVVHTDGSTRFANNAAGEKGGKQSKSTTSRHSIALVQDASITFLWLCGHFSLMPPLRVYLVHA